MKYVVLIAILISCRQSLFSQSFELHLNASYSTSNKINVSLVLHNTSSSIYIPTGIAGELSFNYNGLLNGGNINVYSLLANMASPCNTLSTYLNTTTHNIIISPCNAPLPQSMPILLPGDSMVIGVFYIQNTVPFSFCTPLDLLWICNSTYFTVSTPGSSVSLIGTQSTFSMSSQGPYLFINNNPSSNQIISQSVNSCVPYTWYGNTYSSTGIYTHLAPGPGGCDTNFELHLTIDSLYSSNSMMFSVYNYTWPINGVTYTSSGVYTYAYADSNGCPHLDSLSLTILNPVATTTPSASFTWQVFPNPVKSQTSLTLNGNIHDLPATLTIYNALGMVVQKTTLQSLPANIPIHYLPKGLYFFSVYHELQRVLIE